MTLYIIGLGLHDEKDISIKGLETVRKCDRVYIENYTSLLQCSMEDLEKLYGKEVIPADRTSSEQGAAKIIAEAKKKNVAFLVVGDPLSATTHVELLAMAKEKGVKAEVIHNASVLTAIGITGLQLYKFGRTTSIPFIKDHPHLETPYKVLQQNQYLDMHTLFLLDLKPEENRFMTVSEALEIMQGIESRKKENVIKENMLVVGCARVGRTEALIFSGPLEKIKKADFGKPPHCLIIPANLHFVEQEMLSHYKWRA